MYIYAYKPLLITTNCTIFMTSTIQIYAIHALAVNTITAAMRLKLGNAFTGGY